MLVQCFFNSSAILACVFSFDLIGNVENVCQFIYFYFFTFLFHIDLEAVIFQYRNPYLDK